MKVGKHSVCGRADSCGNNVKLAVQSGTTANGIIELPEGNSEPAAASVTYSFTEINNHNYSFLRTNTRDKPKGGLIHRSRTEITGTRAAFILKFSLLYFFSLMILLFRNHPKLPIIFM